MEYEGGGRKRQFSS